MRSNLILVLILFASTFLFSQNENLIYKTVVFPKNSPHSILNANAPQKDIFFELYGSTSFIQSFSSKVLQNPLVISCTPDTKSPKHFNLRLSPETDFDDLKTLLVQNGIEFVSIEDTIIPIQSWKPFTEEQARRIWELNFTLSNIETKRQWVLQNPDKLEMAKQNGWWEDNTQLLNRTIEEKKNYIRQILK